MTQSTKILTTDRGCSIIQLKDLYGQGFSIQKSSLATDDAIWFGIDDADPKILASQVGKINPETGEISGWVKFDIPEDVLLNTRMHLNREQVAKLIPILQTFVDTGDIYD